MKKYMYLSLCMIAAISFADNADAQGLGSNRGNEVMNLLRNEAVKSELELVDDQVQEIETIMEEMWAEMRERMGKMREFRDLTPEERREKYAEVREEMNERRKKYQEQVNDVLLPAQAARLKQLSVQSRARRTGDGALGVLQNSELLTELGIDEETQKKLKEKTEEVLKELKKKVDKLRKKAEEEILSVLPADKRKVFIEAVGTSFEFGGRSAGAAGSMTQQPLRGGRERGNRGRQDADDK